MDISFSPPLIHNFFMKKLSDTMFIFIPKTMTLHVCDAVFEKM